MPTISTRWTWLPTALVASRAAIAPYLLWDAWDQQVTPAFLALYILAVLSDIFDGIIARRLQISTAQLRQADSWADNALYLCVFAAAWRVHPELVQAWRWPLGAVVISQLLWWAVNLAKYGKPASYHTYSAKAWGLSLVAATIAWFGWQQAGWALGLAVALGIIHSFEEIAMTLILPVWCHDVLSLVHAWRLRPTLLAAPPPD